MTSNLPRNGLLWRFLYRLRPAPLASFIKRTLGISRRVVKTDHGVFWLDPVSNFGQRLLTLGHYEPGMTSELLEVVKPGGTFVDLGANEGWFTIQARRAMGPEGRFLAIEPQSRLQPVLQKNMELNDVANATLFPAIVGSEMAQPSCSSHRI